MTLPGTVDAGSKAKSGPGHGQQRRDYGMPCNLPGYDCSGLLPDAP